MKITWPAYDASLEQHTVTVDGGGLVAGFLVRCTRSRQHLGWVWQASAQSAVWRWRTADGEAWGERSSQKKAVEVVRDCHDVQHGGQRLPFSEAGPVAEEVPQAVKDFVARYAPAPTPTRQAKPAKPTAPPEPPKPVRHIVWNDGGPTHDLTTATADALKKHGGSR